MSLTAKVIATDELFLAATVADADKGNQHDAQPPIDPEKMYMGNLLVGSLSGNSIYVEYTEPATKWFKGSELEEVPGDVRLIPMHERPPAAEPDVDAEIAKAVQDMDDAEDALVTLGFSMDQWMLIKKYVHAAIVQSQWATAKAWKNLPQSSSPGTATS
jgi:hypothetical protein